MVLIQIKFLEQIMAFWKIKWQNKLSIDLLYKTSLMGFMYVEIKVCRMFTLRSTTFRGVLQTIYKGTVAQGSSCKGFERGPSSHYLIWG